MRETAAYLALDIAIPVLFAGVILVMSRPMPVRIAALIVAVGALGLLLAWFNYRYWYLEVTDSGVTVCRWWMRRSYRWEDVESIDWGPYEVFCQLKRPTAVSGTWARLRAAFLSRVELAGRRHGWPSGLAARLRAWKDRSAAR